MMTLGYDVREPVVAASWTKERRGAFLIRPDVLQPLSVDHLVWPHPVEIPAEVSPLPLWGSVSEARNAFADTGTEAPLVIEIALADITGIGHNWTHAFEGMLHPEMDRWLHLDFHEYGYDVADRYLTSGLSNCMLSAEEMEAVRPRWVRRVNDYGLLSKPADATEFAMVCDANVPEHAPFFAYRLRCVLISHP